MHSNPFEDPNPFVDPPNSLDKPEEAILAQPWLKLTSGRPNLEHILGEEINAASGRVSVSGGCSVVWSVLRADYHFKFAGPAPWQRLFARHFDFLGRVHLAR